MVDTFLQMRGSQIGCGSESAEWIVRVAIELGERHRCARAWTRSWMGANAWCRLRLRDSDGLLDGNFDLYVLRRLRQFESSDRSDDGNKHFTYLNFGATNEEPGSKRHGERGRCGKRNRPGRTGRSGS
jgi:hypothetical protein